MQIPRFSGSLLDAIQQLASSAVRALGDEPTCPTLASHDLWLEFIAPHEGGNAAPWSAEDHWDQVEWTGKPIAAGTPLRIATSDSKAGTIYTSAHREVGKVVCSFNRNAVGLTIVTATGAKDRIDFEYIGPDDLNVH